MLEPAATRRMRAASGGFATSVWRVETDQGAYALRAFRPHELSVLWREVAVQQRAAAAGLPVPRVHAVGTYEERPAMLTDWCPGRPLLESLQAEPWRLLQLGHAFGQLQRRMHRVHAPNGLRGTWVDWPKQCESALAHRLLSLPLARDRLLHLDYHPLNVLASGARLTAIIDWTNAHAGDPRADVARTLTILRLPPPGTVSGGERAVLSLFELGWRAGYGSFGSSMAPFYAWAGAAMLADLAQRYAPGELEHARRWTAYWSKRAG
jgi:aminoglycoside phosphotransferase (APT) family kinase protein